MSANGQNLNKKWSKLPREIKKREYHAQFWLILEKSHAFLRLFFATAHGRQPILQSSICPITRRMSALRFIIYLLGLPELNLRGFGSDAAISEAWRLLSRLALLSKWS